MTAVCHVTVPRHVISKRYRQVDRKRKTTKTIIGAPLPLGGVGEGVVAALCHFVLAASPSNVGWNSLEAKKNEGCARYFALP